MKNAKVLSGLAVLVLLLPAGLAAQDKDKDPDAESPAEHGTVEFGVRYSEGVVYGRPDLQTGQCLGCGSPFNPALSNSKFNEYQDMRNGFYIRRMDLHYDHILGSKNYATLKSQRTLYRDQSYLATFGQYGKFKIQFRYDEIPHIYTSTARTLFTQSAPGVWSFPAAIRAQLQASSAANLPSLIAGTGANAAIGVVNDFNFITPSILRRAGTASFSYNVTAKWNVFASFMRESERGARPIGLIMNSSPSASATSGYGLELPEPINYFNNLLRVGVDYGSRAWGVQAAYIGSFFQNDTTQMTWDNPFRLTGETVANPLTGRMALYPDNQAHYASFAGATDLTKYLRLSASVTPGWLRQNQAFLPYTTNTAINTCGSGTQACDSTSVLPESSLSGSKKTLAMNYNVVTTAWKNIQLKASYRQYDYTNDTAVFTFTPVEGDAAAPTTAQNTPFGYNRKDVEASGEWFFGKKSSLKAGYQGEWMDRTDRDVERSMENSFYGAVDWAPIKDLMFRVSYRYSDRNPDAYQDDQASDPVSGNPVLCTDTTTVSFTGDQRCHRRFDEAARLRNRADALLQYSPTDKLTLSAFGGTDQNNYNRAGGANSPTPLNFLAGAAATVGSYYLYGVLKDISSNYGLDADYAVAAQVTVFAELSRENYHKRMITRYRTPTTGVQTILTCTGCDSANNDWESVAQDPVDIYSGGVDMYLTKKAYFTAYYTLTAGKGNVTSRPLGDPTILTGVNAFLLIGTNAAVSYPETVNRNHEVAAIFRYKITENLVPRIEYHYQQWDNKDYQTSDMTQYMGCISPIPNGPPVTNAVPGCTTPVLTSNVPGPVGVASPFYPYFVVGDPSAARYLFLGVDQPSYHAHTVAATLEYRF
ncbi:MAG TPA: MtrB/PioB family outer membrane beta-barrel protein [Candidatus Acidoferrales bacterium]|nr:MtrB/PioB family outer membrane beta-barrel protein [Candidatus Acidoferrales bacterium]